MSVHAVFQTTELLEQILRRLDLQTLLLSQRVSKGFFATISGSLALQYMLFFTADRSKDISKRQNNSWGHSDKNPLLWIRDIPLRHPRLSNCDAKMILDCDNMILDLNNANERKEEPVLIVGKESWSRMYVHREVWVNSIVVWEYRSPGRSAPLSMRTESRPYTMGELVEKAVELAQSVYVLPKTSETDQS